MPQTGRPQGGQTAVQASTVRQAGVEADHLTDGELSLYLQIVGMVVAAGATGLAAMTAVSAFMGIMMDRHTIDRNKHLLITTVMNADLQPRNRDKKEQDGDESAGAATHVNNPSYCR